MTSKGSLRIESLYASYGRMQIVSNLAMEVQVGERVAVVGRNGAGKTTTLLSISGSLPGTCSCSIYVDGVRVRRHTPAEVVKAGVTVVPEGHQVFLDLTVRENLHLGAFHLRRRGRVALARSVEQVFSLFPLLARDQHRQAGQLSGGGQQMVAVGQGLMAGPQYMFLDEPSSGLAPAVVQDIYSALSTLCAGGTAVIVVEQNVERALAWAERCYVLDNGQIALEGESGALIEGGQVTRLVRGLGPSQVVSPGAALVANEDHLASGTGSV